MHVLDAGFHPPHKTPHDIETYPLFYDALYYPQFYPHIFCSSGSFCSWSQGSLISRRVSCANCCDRQGHVTVTFNHERLSVDVCSVVISFSTAYFEAADCSHCRLFARCKAQCVFELDGTQCGSVTMKLTIPLICVRCRVLFFA